jgi:cytidylate kinase
MGIHVTEAAAEKDVRERDERDQGRDIAPLAKAKDAIIIETTGKSIEQILKKLMEVVRAHP